METCQLYPNTVTKTLNTEKPKPSNWIKTPSNSNRNITHLNTTEETLTQEEKKECRGFEENDVWKKYHIITSQEPRLENSQNRNWKNKRIVNTYLNEQRHGIKQTNLCRSKINLWKSRGPSKEHEQKSETKVEN